MNYAGTYRNTPAHLADQAAAENLSIIENLVVNKEQRFPDIAYFSPELDPISNEHFVLQHAQEFHTSYWGHLGVLNLTRNLILPGYVAYPNTAAASPFPTNAQVADLAHGQTALVGYVHPLESVPHPEKDPLTYELPADVALGKVDYIEVVGFADHKSTAEVWYKLLNCGFRLPTAGGTDFMIPCCRHNSAVVSPASPCFRIAMICSLLCRVPFIAVLLLGLGELTFYLVRFLGAGSLPPCETRGLLQRSSSSSGRVDAWERKPTEDRSEAKT